MLMNPNQINPNQMALKLLMRNTQYTTAADQAKGQAAANLQAIVPQAETALVQQPNTQMNNLNANVVNNNNEGKGKDDGGIVSEERERQILDELCEEFGIKQNKGNVKEWAKLTGTGAVDVVGKEGQKVDDITKQTIVVHSKNHGDVTIKVGGDGELNGKDDEIVAMTGQTGALNGQAGAGNALMGQPNTAYGEGVVATPTAAGQMGGLNAGGATNPMANLMLQMNLDKAKQNIADNQRRETEKLRTGEELNGLIGQDGIGKAAEAQGVNIDPAIKAAENPLGVTMSEINSLIALIQGIGVGTLKQ